MARIRSIKPEFWTDAALIECSLNARLLFIGTWNFADDEGNLDRSAKQIKARVFPADSVHCEPLIQELLTHGLLNEYSVNGKKYLNINGFKKHQVINRPGKPACPLYESSLNTHGILSEDSLPEGKGMEGKLTTLSGKPDVVPLNGHAVETAILAYLNEKAGRDYRPVKANVELIAARLKDGATADDLRGVIDRKCAQWAGNEKMEQYLRPATLFNATKFAQYAGELDTSERPRRLVI